MILAFWRSCWRNWVWRLYAPCLKPNVPRPVYAPCLCNLALEIVAQCVAPVICAMLVAQCVAPVIFGKISPTLSYSPPNTILLCSSLFLKCKWTFQLKKRLIYKEPLNFWFAKPTFTIFWKWLYFEPCFEFFHFIRTCDGLNDLCFVCYAGGWSYWG